MRAGSGATGGRGGSEMNVSEYDPHTHTHTHTEPIIGSAQVIPTSLKLMTFVGGIAARYSYCSSSVSHGAFVSIPCPAHSGSGSVYEDDGHTIAYQDNAYTTQNFSYSIKE